MTGVRAGERRRAMFQFRVRPELLDEYAREHAAVWPQMLRALQEAGWENYSIFTRPDGLVVGYFESSDPDAVRAAMGLREVNARWQEAMARFFSGAGPDEQMDELTEIFHLETQLATADHTATDHTAAGEAARTTRDREGTA